MTEHVAHNPRVRDSQGQPDSPSVRTLATQDSPWLSYSSDLATALWFAVAKARTKFRKHETVRILWRPATENARSWLASTPQSTLPSPCSRPSMSEYCRIAALLSFAAGFQPHEPGQHAPTVACGTPEGQHPPCASATGGACHTTRLVAWRRSLMSDFCVRCRSPPSSPAASGPRFNLRRCSL